MGWGDSVEKEPQDTAELAEGSEGAESCLAPSNFSSKILHLAVEDKM